MQASTIDDDVWLQHRWLNRVHSVALLLFMGGFLGMLGWLLWGTPGLVALLLVGAVGVMLNPSTSPRWVMRMYKATPLDARTAPGLAHAIAALAERAGLHSAPALYYIPSSVLNAFAVGAQQNAAIGVTDGLLQRLDDRELLGVLAHEVSHIQTNDVWVMGLADMFSRATSILSLFGQLLLFLNLPLILMGSATFSWWAVLLLIFAPHLSALAQLALSRTREYDADLNAARLTGDPKGLASALLKIERLQGGWLEKILLPGRKIPDPSLLRTHPLTEDRVRRLAALKPAETLGVYQPQPAQRPYSAPRPGPVTRHPRWHLNGLWH